MRFGTNPVYLGEVKRIWLHASDLLGFNTVRVLSFHVPADVRPLRTAIDYPHLSSYLYLAQGIQGWKIHLLSLQGTF